MKSGIYAIKQKSTNRKYVGSAKNLNIRRTRHFHNLRKGIHHNARLQNAFNKYGESDFEWVVLQEAEDNLLELEKDWIESLDTVASGFNISCEPSSPFLGRRHTDETKATMSKRMLGNKNCLGHVQSEDHKSKLSLSHIGMRNALGCKRSEETRRKMSEAQRTRRAKEKNNG